MHPLKKRIIHFHPNKSELTILILSLSLLALYNPEEEFMVSSKQTQTFEAKLMST